MRSRLSFAILLAGLIGLAFAPVAAQEELSAARIFELPGDDIYPEGVTVNNETGTFYVGATGGGAILQGDIASGDVSVLSEGGSDGRTAVTGMAVADDGSLYAAGASTGSLFVIDTETGDTIESASNGLGEEETFLNDLVLDDEGTVYITDSINPTIWTMGDGALEPWLDLTDSAITYEDGFNLNGIVLSEDGSTLLVVQANTGNLFRIDIESQESEQVDLGEDGLLPGGDGMVLDGSFLYVVGSGEIKVVTLEDDLSAGSITSTITDSSFSSPTTAAQTGACLLVVNSQFENRGSPELPFTISGIAVPFENVSTPVAMEDVIACAVG